MLGKHIVLWEHTERCLILDFSLEEAGAELGGGQRYHRVSAYRCQKRPLPVVD